MATLKKQMAVEEKRIVVESLERNKFNQNAVAVELDISRVTVYNKMILHGLKVKKDGGNTNINDPREAGNEGQLESHTEEADR